MTGNLESVIRDLVVANRILGNEDVVDAYGHVSIRHPTNPERYFLSCSRSPELVERNDIIEFHLDGTPVAPQDRPFYIERFIHGATYEMRPDVNAVVHSHAEDVLPFGIAPTPLQPVIHSGAFMGREVPVWDIADNFGDTNLLVVDMAQGRDLARGLGGTARVVLMRGHGFAAAAPSLLEVVRLSIYLPKNARVQMKAAQLGGFKPLSQGEITNRLKQLRPSATESYRAWEYWAHRAGCREML